MPRRLLPATASATVLAAGLGLAACGGSQTNGVQAKAPEAILTASRQAADGAASVHVVESIASTGAPTTFDLDLVREQGGRGTLSVNGLSLHLIRVGPTIYVKGSPAFYRNVSADAARRLHGRWLKVASTSGSFAAVGRLTNMADFLERFLPRQSNKPLSKGAAATIAGQKVVPVKDSTGGTLSVAAAGKPFPIQIAKGGASGGTISFDRWNAAVALRPPADSVDLKQLQAGK